MLVGPPASLLLKLPSRFSYSSLLSTGAACRHIVAYYGRPTAIHLQIARALEAEIRGGRIAPGTRLPTVREIAVTLSVPTSTVQRAMSELAGTRIIVAQGSAGTFVRSDLSGIASIDERTKRFVRSVLEDIDRLGYDRKVVANLIAGERKQQ